MKHGRRAKVERAYWEALAQRVPRVLQQQFEADSEAQLDQYPAQGPPGVTYFKGEVEGGWVDCLLYYHPHNGQGRLVGVLNHYPMDFPPHEQKGNFNLWVHPDYRRQGIGSVLLDEGTRRWQLNLLKQEYTPLGFQFALGYVAKKGERDANEADGSTAG